MKLKINNLNKGARSRIIILALFLIFIIRLIVIVSALTSDERIALENELNSLEGNLNENGYSWQVSQSEINGVKNLK